MSLDEVAESDGRCHGRIERNDHPDRGVVRFIEGDETDSSANETRFLVDELRRNDERLGVPARADGDSGGLYWADDADDADDRASPRASSKASRVSDTRLWIATAFCR